MKTRVCILPLKTALSTLSLAEDLTLVIPLSVSGYTLNIDNTYGPLIIGVSIFTLSELEDFLCGFLGYKEIKKALSVLLPIDIEKIERIMEKYSPEADQPIAKEWLIIKHYIKSMGSK